MHYVCPVCRDLDRNTRLVDALDEAEIKQLQQRHGEKLPPSVRRPADGRRTSVRPKTPAAPKSEPRAL